MNYLLGILIAAGLLIFGLAWLTETSNQRIVAQAQAQAIITQANAQATAIMVTAVTPLVIVILAGLVILVLAIGWAIRQRSGQPKVIERQTIYILPAGSPRREFWQTLSDNRPELAKLPNRIEVRNDTRSD